MKDSMPNLEAAALQAMAKGMFQSLEKVLNAAGTLLVDAASVRALQIVSEHTQDPESIRCFVDALKAFDRTADALVEAIKETKRLHHLLLAGAADMIVGQPKG